MDSISDREIAEPLARARALAARAEDAAAREAYLEVLRRDPTHCIALNELGNLALSGGFRSAARTAYLQAVQHHPANKVAHVNLANLLRVERDVAGARRHYEAALAIDPEMPEAHQGLGWVLDELGAPGAEWHREKGYAGHALVTQPYRGTGAGIPLLLLVSARVGNIATAHWLSDRRYSITAIYADYYPLDARLPPHALIVNAVSDADLCGPALERARILIAASDVPVLNAPARVQLTRRLDNARRLAGIDGVIAPAIRAMTPQAVLSANDLRFPLLLRRPGFHNGEYFALVKHRDGLSETVAALCGDELLVIEYLDARGADGMARKYRVMFIDGVAYPLHLAISADWKVHYVTSAMRHSAALREEERRFLECMPAVLGPRAMAALAQICATLGLDYAGIDFALAPDGSVMLFEANATMIVFSPDPDPIWDYRRAAIDAVMAAAAGMVLRRAGRDDELAAAPVGALT
ncbi:MAG: tetratricopeptide repeat protein [Steroidobacteraceae bacterium]